jgi:hypothetical protein
LLLEYIKICIILIFFLKIIQKFDKQVYDNIISEIKY